MQIKARRCFLVHSPSRWVARIFLTCDNMLAVEFRHGQHVKKVLPHGPGAYIGHGGVPHVCCLYPGTQGELAETLYELAQTWSYGGEWVHHFLYKKFGYQLVAPPLPCGNCNTSCSLQINPPSPQKGQAVTITCRVTNIDGSPTKGAAPQGKVTFTVDGVKYESLDLPLDDPDSKNWAEVSVSWNASCEPLATHTWSVQYFPAAGDWAPTECSASVTVSNCGVVVPCCAVPMPETLYVTISDGESGLCACLAGTYPIYFSGKLAGDPVWLSPSGGYPGCVAGNVYNITLRCVANGNLLIAIGSFVAPKQCGFTTDNFLLQGSCANPVSLSAQGLNPIACGGDCSFGSIGSVNVAVTG